jgi:hypothetical protein
VFENRGLDQTCQPEGAGPIPGQDRPDGALRAREQAARAAIEQGACRPLSDVEWAEARSRLVGFGVILRGWGSKAKSTDRELGNVDAICQQEL